MSELSYGCHDCHKTSDGLAHDRCPHCQSTNVQRLDRLFAGLKADASAQHVRGRLLLPLPRRIRIPING